MSLPLHLFIHFSLSLVVGGIVWIIWKKPIESFVSAICGGFLVDLDHFLDYLFAFGLHFRSDYFFHGYQFLKSDKIYVLFHGWEYVIILGAGVFAAKSIKVKSVLLGLSLGMLVHLSADVILNEMPVKSYSISYRISQNFDLKNLVFPEHYRDHVNKKKEVKFE